MLTSKHGSVADSNPHLDRHQETGAHCSTGLCASSSGPSSQVLVSGLSYRVRDGLRGPDSILSELLASVSGVGGNDHMELRITVDLIKECPTCSGIGRRYRDLEDLETMLETCEICYGMGVVPSTDGQALLDFINEFTEIREQKRFELEGE